MTTYNTTLTNEDRIYLGGQNLLHEHAPIEHGHRYYRVAAVASLVLAAFAILVIPGIIALLLGHTVLHNTERDVPRTEITRGYALAGLVVTYSTFAVGFLLVVLPHLFA